MCRISGIFSNVLNNQNTLIYSQQMGELQKNGGPDDEGIWQNEERNLTFSHKRLSILDLSILGHQPMETSKTAVCFNGEIYNYKSIRKDLESKGYKFKSNTDTEVILFAYEEWGSEAFSMFNGMFAFALYDKQTKDLFLVRDTNGIKPLYYYFEDNQLFFASEVKAFQKLPIRLNENKDWKILFLVFGHIPEPFSTIENVKMVEKGSYIKFNTVSYTFKKVKFKYKSLNTSQNRSLLNKSDIVRTSLIDSVERQLISDAPTSILLSGGIDSSIITLIAQKIKSDITSISISFEDKNLDESYYQNLINKISNTNNISFKITEKDFTDNIYDLFEAYDQPTTDGINSYFVSKAVKNNNIKVALSGIGADEIFGGYPSFYPSFPKEIAKKIGKIIPIPTQLINDIKAKKIEYLKIDDNLGEYLFYRSNFPPSEIAKILDCSESYIYDVLSQFYLNNLTQKLNKWETTSFYEKNIYCQNQLLKDSDFMSMWHGVELRIPFFDNEFLENISSIQISNHSDRKTPKKLLIDAFKNELPREIWDRPKKGFSFPLQKWLKNKSILDELHNSRNKGIQKVAYKFENDQIHWSRFWSLFMMNLFEKKQFAYSQNKVKELYSN